MEETSPKKKYNKHKIKGTLMVFLATKKNIKKTGIYKGLINCAKLRYSPTVPAMVIIINKHNAPKKSLLNLRFKVFFMVDVHKLG